MLSMNSYTQAALERAGWAAAADTTFCRCAERLRRIAVARFSSHEQSMVAAAGSDPVRRVRAHGRPPGRSKLRPRCPARDTARYGCFHVRSNLREKVPHSLGDRV